MVTVCAPVVLMCPGSWIRFLSSSGPPAALTAAATSAAVTEPNSRPPSPARALERDGQRLQLGLDLAGVAEVADLAGVAGPLDLGDLLLGALGPVDRRAARHQVVAAVAVGDLDDVAGAAEAGDLAGQDELHRARPPQRAVEV